MKVTIIPIVIGAFGTVTKGLLKGLEDLEVGGLVETIQTRVLLKTARILRRVLEIEETCCHSKSGERPSTDADVKNSKRVPLVRYSGPFLEWTREELKQMDKRTGKLMTMHKALHPRDDIDRLYVSRKEGGRGLASIEDIVDASIQRLEDYVEKHEQGLITTIRVDTDNTVNEIMITTRKQKWEGKQIYGRFKRLVNNISHQKTWTWLRKGNLKRETESLLIAA